MKPSCIGVTGYIGTGKSTVTRILAEITGWYPVSLDQLGHEAYSDLPIREKILQHFNDEVLNIDGSINRKVIGEIVFRSEIEKNWLEKTIWPVIIQKAKKLMKAHRKCILDGVILFPSGLAKNCQCILLIQARKGAMEERALRKGYSEELINKMLQSQKNSLYEEKQSIPIITVNNNGTCQELVRTLTSLWERRLRNYFEQDETTETKKTMDIKGVPEKVKKESRKTEG